MATTLSDPVELDPDSTEELPVLDLPDERDPTLAESGHDGHGTEMLPAPVADVAEHGLPPAPSQLALLAELTLATDALEQARRAEAAAAQRATAASERAAAAVAEAAACQRDTATAQDEIQLLRAALAARDATILQIQHTIGERDNQIAELRRQRAADAASLQKAQALEQQLAHREQGQAGLVVELQRAKGELAETVRDLSTAKAQTAAYLEVLQTQDWRQAYVESQLAVPTNRRPPAPVGGIESGIAAAAGDRRDDWIAVEPADPDIRVLRERLAAAERRNAEQAAQIQQLELQADAAEDEINVLLAHLQVSRMPARDDEEANRAAAPALAAPSVSGTPSAAVASAAAAAEARAAAIARPSAAASAPAVARLVRVDDGTEREHPIVRRLQIGRLPGSDVRLEFSSVSRHHAAILVTSSGIVIDDLNSTNGVFVNGTRVKRQALVDGDAIAIGEANFRFRLGAADAGLPETSPEPAAGSASTPI